MILLKYDYKITVSIFLLNKPGGGPRDNKPHETMTTYKKKLNQHVIYNGYDYLTSDEKKALRADVKTRDGVLLKNCNGRATIRKNENGDAILTSYYTDVAIIAGGHFFKTWAGYSATTLKHVNDFRKIYGFAPLNKKEWIMMPEV